ncbi:hypothetical protein PAXRUDRAFT_828850 [Paxillus rubicundulus Ve08.2h10]|uniref:Unplaced genomic scaffold scaffold_353, whole genome shotgun sequence n=1 Tax=Paxillus rubicundulus Ve08.2h10 TaxID=930991 RepID=A0A0D0DVK2_9AGAM|nr:hypothetical protein PAXRUDRAFT_828850 [Paxillus rubicundulus Ve08.2h10]
MNQQVKQLLMILVQILSLLFGPSGLRNPITPFPILTLQPHRSCSSTAELRSRIVGRYEHVVSYNQGYTCSS